MLLEKHTSCWGCNKLDTAKREEKKYNDVISWVVHECQECNAKKYVCVLRGSPMEGVVEYAK